MHSFMGGQQKLHETSRYKIQQNFHTLFDILQKLSERKNELTVSQAI